MHGRLPAPSTLSRLHEFAWRRTSGYPKGLVKNGPSGTGYGGTRYRIRAASPGRRRTASALPPARAH
jgi:hypothetical protein